MADTKSDRKDATQGETPVAATSGKDFAEAAAQEDQPVGLVDEAGDPVAEEAITHPQDTPHIDPFGSGERYLPGDPPPGQSMFPPGVTPS